MDGLNGARESVNEVVLRCIEDWKRLYPHEESAIKAKVQAIRATQKRFSTVESKMGFGGSREMLHKAEVPETLYWMIWARLGRDWTRDRRVVNFFLKNFKVGLVNRTSEIKV